AILAPARQPSPSRIVKPAPESFWENAEDVPEVEIHGRRRPPPPKAQAPADPDVVPEISAGPKKRVLEGGPVVPREIAASVPLPKAPPKQKPLRAEDFPSNPNLKKEESKPVPRAAEVAPPPKWKHVPPPKRESRLVQTLAFWTLILGGCAALFAVGALGVPARAGDGLWVSLPRPFIAGDAGLLIRLCLAVGGAGLLVSAFLANRKLLRETSHPGPAVMVPIFAALCFFAAGLSSPATGQGPDLVSSGAEGTLRMLVHPVNLAVLAVWSLAAALMFGLSGGDDLDYSAGSILLMLSLGAVMGFAAGGNIPAIVGRCMDSPSMLILPGGAILVALLGLFLAFSPRARSLRRGAGVVVILAALSLGYYGGVQSTQTPDPRAPVSGILGELPGHGLGFILGLVLLSWAAWIVHRMKTSTFGARR
ncbi:MAG: hypothetical protein JO332_17435, partial [Planctomycetaceae bacterium]|nr:hypothetical protein [Planctomycetaceae bacterium]